MGRLLLVAQGEFAIYAMLDWGRHPPLQFAKNALKKGKFREAHISHRIV